MARWGLRSRTRSRMPVRSSRAIPRPVRSASATTLFAILWLMSFARRASLRRRFFSRRLAEAVFFHRIGVWLDFWDLAGDIEEPHAVPMEQVRLTLAVLGKGHQLLHRASECQALDPPGHRPDRHRALLDPPGQHPVVIRLSTLAPEGQRLPGRPPVMLRARPAVPPGPQIRPQGGVSVAGLLDDVLSRLRPQPPPLLDRLVGVPAQGEVPVGALFEGNPTHPGGGLVACAQSRLECLRLHRRRQQLHLHHELHGTGRYRRCNQQALLRWGTTRSEEGSNLCSTFVRHLPAIANPGASSHGVAARRPGPVSVRRSLSGRSNPDNDQITAMR